MVIQPMVITPGLQVAAVATEPFPVNLDGSFEPFVDLARVGFDPVLFAMGKKDRI